MGIDTSKALARRYGFTAEILSHVAGNKADEIMKNPNTAFGQMECFDSAKDAPA